MEAEVARRLAEREEERIREEEARKADEEARKNQEEAQRTFESAAKDKQEDQGLESVTSGVLAPLLRRQEDLDGDLRKRLHELEQKL